MLKPLTYSGSVDFDSAIDSAALPMHLRDCLLQEHASSVELRGNRVEFTAGLFRMVGSWNVLVPFGSGDLTVDPEHRQVRYSLSARQFVLLGTVMVSLISGFMLFGTRSLTSLAFIPFMLLWLVGGNLVIGVPRFHNFVRRALSSAPRTRAIPV